MLFAHFLARLSPRRLSAAVLLMTFGGSVLAMSALYFQAITQKKADLRRHALDLAIAAAALVDVDRQEQLVRPDQLDSPAYREALAPLLAFHRHNAGIQYLWTVRVTPRDEQLFLLYTGTDPAIRQWQESLGRDQTRIPFLGPNTETDRGRASVPLLREGRPYVFPDIYTDEHDSYIEARAPLFATSGRFVGYLGIDYALDSYRHQVNAVRLGGLATLLLALVLSLVLAGTAELLARRNREALAEVQRERDAAARANEAKGEILRIAAHDLKNPLVAISGLAGLLAQRLAGVSGAVTAEETRTVLETIHGSAQHMSEIVRGILMNEGLEQGGLALQAAPTDVAQLVEAVLRFNAAPAQKKGIAVRRVGSAGLTAVVDAKLMREAFDNYVSNAIKYSPLGGAVAVSLEPAAAGGFEFAVQDAGPGLSAADQAQLFHKFKKLTPRPTGGESSTGLGLSIVKTVAGLHGGTVGCDSEEGRGARFWLRVPAEPPAGAA